MWKYITKLGGDFFGVEISEDILPLAQAAGLCCRVGYDPEIHGEAIEAEPGDEIWWWGRQEERPDQVNPPSSGSAVEEALVAKMAMNDTSVRKHGKEF